VDNPSDATEGRATTTLPIPDTDGDGKPDFQDVDSDNDGISDLIEGGTDAGNDTNNDGMIDSAVNPNGIPAIVDPATGTPVTTPDTDGDHTPNYRDLDSDNDGLNDVEEAGGADTDHNGVIDTDGTLVDGRTLPDEDGDGTPDPLEPNNPDMPAGTDPDGNGVIDGDQATDTDGDGIPDIVDPSDGFSDGGATIQGIFWIDNNSNGVRDADESEIIAGAKVELLDENGNPVPCTASLSARAIALAAGSFCTTTTDANGHYTFTGLAPAKYQVRFTLPRDKQDQGYKFTTNGTNENNKRIITVTVDTRLAKNSNVTMAAAVNCSCANIASDSGDAMSSLTLILMMLSTLLSGLFFVRRDEKSTSI
jgi:hypothetical protein